MCNTPAGLSSSVFVHTHIYIYFCLMDMKQSFIKVGLFCSGRVDVTELSLENDVV